MTRNARSPKLTVERLADDCLDVREFHRAGLLTDTRRRVLSSLKFPAIQQILVDRWMLQIVVNQIPQQIRVSWSRCFFGGERPWLHCSYCDRRVAKLYRGLGGYCCRPCIGNPLYASQTKSTQGRRHFEACKLRLRLNGDASLTQPFPERPQGMQRKTYARLQRRAEGLEADLSPRIRARGADYRNLVYYLPRPVYK